MEEDFVPVKIANKLKEKGFNKPCVAYYVSSCSKLYFNITQLRGCTVEDCFISRNTQHGNSGITLTDAPTISQVFKWLRKEKELHIEPCILADADADADGKIINEYAYWSFSVTSIETGDMIYFEYEHIDDKRFDSYEQASLAGIEYVIDKLI